MPAQIWPSSATSQGGKPEEVFEACHREILGGHTSSLGAEFSSPGTPPAVAVSGANSEVHLKASASSGRCRKRGDLVGSQSRPPPGEKEIKSNQKG